MTDLPALGGPKDDVARAVSALGFLFRSPRFYKGAINYKVPYWVLGLGFRIWVVV